ncbi:MAG: hypothetical protein ACU85U_00895 [Gammaproteobacteria bacterium]|jgi:hypothetical protein
MKKVVIALVASAAFGLSSQTFAEEATKMERAGEGIVETVTSPGQIVEGVAEDAEAHGPVVGTVTGTVKGTAKAATQAVTGAAKVGVGAVETILSPVTGD